jgi:hypothetical protein
MKVMNFNHIKKYIVVTALFALPLSSIAQNAFEGVIEMKTLKAKGNENDDVKWFVKGGNVKISVNSTYDKGSLKYDLVLTQGSSTAKFVTNYNGEDVVFDGKPNGAASATGAAVATFHKTNETREILGHKCYLAKDDRGLTTVWVCDDCGIDLSKMPSVVQQGDLSPLIASGITGLPMQITSMDEQGNMLFSQTVTGINASPVDNAAFDTSKYRSGEEAMKEQSK